MNTTELPTVVGAIELEEALRAGGRVRVLDVRTPAEFETSHIAGAYNVPVDTIGEHGAELRDVRDPVVLVCRSGQRARRAEQALRESGLESLHVLEGGMAAWESAGLAVLRGRKRWALERQVRLVAGSIVLVGALGSLIFPPLLWVAAFIGAGLTFSALTDTCTMGLLLSRLPYNRAATCDVDAVVARLRAESGAAA